MPESDMDAEKLSKRDTLKRKERKRKICTRTHALTRSLTHSLILALARSHEGEEKEEIKGRRGRTCTKREIERKKKRWSERKGGREGQEGEEEEEEGEESLV